MICYHESMEKYYKVIVQIGRGGQRNIREEEVYVEANDPLHAMAMVRKVRKLKNMQLVNSFEITKEEYDRAMAARRARVAGYGSWNEV